MKKRREKLIEKYFHSMNKKKKKGIFLILFLVNLFQINGFFALYPWNVHNQKDFLVNQEKEEIIGCSVITLSIGNTTLFGYNLDGHDSLDPFISFGDHLLFNDGTDIKFPEPIAFTGRMLPGGPRDGYGFFKTSGFCHAGNSLGNVPMYVDPNKTDFFVNSSEFFPENDWQSVGDVKNFFSNYNYLRSDPPEWGWQYHCADASGQAVVVAVDEEKKVGFIDLNSSEFLISTNHNLLDYTHFDGDYDESLGRYNTAYEFLVNIDSEEQVTISNIRDILKAISVDSTTHSLIFNPRSLEIYIYHPEDFENHFYFNLTSEIEKLTPGEATLYNITDLYVQSLSDDSLSIPIFMSLGLFSSFVVVFILIKKHEDLS